MNSFNHCSSKSCSRLDKYGWMQEVPFLKPRQKVIVSTTEVSATGSPWERVRVKTRLSQGYQGYSQTPKAWCPQVPAFQRLSIHFPHFPQQDSLPLRFMAASQPPCVSGFPIPTSCQITTGVSWAPSKNSWGRGGLNQILISG